MTDADLDELECLLPRRPARTAQDDVGTGGVSLSYGQLRPLIDEVRRLRRTLEDLRTCGCGKVADEAWIQYECHICGNDE